MTDTNERLLKSIINKHIRAISNYYVVKVKDGVVTLKLRGKGRFIKLDLNTGIYETHKLVGQRVTPSHDTQEERDVVFALVNFSGKFGDY